LKVLKSYTKKPIELTKSNQYSLTSTTFREAIMSQKCKLNEKLKKFFDTLLAQSPLRPRLPVFFHFIRRHFKAHIPERKQKEKN
jgi:hypothetical protein